MKFARIRCLKHLKGSRSKIYFLSFPFHFLPPTWFSFWHQLKLYPKLCLCRPLTLKHLQSTGESEKHGKYFFKNLLTFARHSQITYLIRRVLEILMVDTLLVHLTTESWRPDMEKMLVCCDLTQHIHKWRRSWVTIGCSKKSNPEVSVNSWCRENGNANVGNATNKTYLNFFKLIRHNHTSC